ncbi:hypothetical protein DL766_008883 [Monosporascus sp. MC13-8B]|uniref:Ras-related protein Rab-18 n=1 Tax=Monosporascus cannonballus TaxID=155416 RepID=A0ABY0HJF2_9PEZI|nr:hypothetical protein DL762_000894 [Monosporascus cannonballus]RYO95536.1 hypothetical protein DL763_003688 [Monosporascus cannonballus]RYP17545.1 hypothetical protein DL766_008883 [Monosporascus sp. MC13-8B]
MHRTFRGRKVGLYCEDQFDPESSTATIGIDFKMKKLAIRGKAYRLNIFDTAGQERFRTLSTSYYRGAHGVMIVYDISSRKSFLGLEKWVDEARSNVSPGAVLYLVRKFAESPSAAHRNVSADKTTKVGSKLDKAASGGRAVSFEEGKAFAEAQGIGFCEVSSKTRENVRTPFLEVVDQIVRKPELISTTTRRGNTLDLSGGTSYIPACPC